MPNLALADIGLTRPEKEALFLLGMAISGGDPAFRTRDGSAAGCWAMNIREYGQAPTTAAAQAVIASALWRRLRAGTLRDLPMDGTARMVALSLVGWFAPAKYSSAANGKDAPDILGRAGLSSWAAQVSRAAAMYGSALFSSPPAGDVPPSSEPEPPSTPAKRGGWGKWLLLACAAGIAVWWFWIRKKGA